MRFVSALCALSLLGTSCAFPASRGGRGALYQSCGAACSAAANPSTGEILMPAASRSTRILNKLVEAAEATRGLATLERALTGAELDLVERVLKDCVAQAHADVNESYQQTGKFKFKNGKFPDDEECKKITAVDANGEKTSLARALGILKHAVAFACIEARLPEGVRDNFAVEPRYQSEPGKNGVALANQGTGSLRPDFVIHGTRNATDVQCVYDLKFPCPSSNKLDPLTMSGAEEQLKSYQDLTRRCPAAIISPQGLFELRK